MSLSSSLVKKMSRETRDISALRHVLFVLCVTLRGLSESSGSQEQDCQVFARPAMFFCTVDNGSEISLRSSPFPFWVVVQGTGAKDQEEMPGKHHDGPENAVGKEAVMPSAPYPLHCRDHIPKRGGGREGGREEMRHKG